jgi:stage V sporulation protein G
MGISVRIRKLIDGHPRKKAVMTVTLGGMFAIHGVVLMERNDGAMYVGMPGKLDDNGVYRDIAHPVSSEARRLLEDAAIKAYREHITF